MAAKPNWLGVAGRPIDRRSLRLGFAFLYAPWQKCDKKSGAIAVHWMHLRDPIGVGLINRSWQILDTPDA